MQTLLSLSKSFSPVPGLTIWMLPYRPYIWAQVREQFMKHLAGEPMEGIHHVFINAIPLVTSIVVEGDVPSWATALAACHPVNIRDITTTWELFSRTASDETLTALWRTYEATREQLPQAPAELQQPAPVPEDEEGEPNPTTASGGRSSRKNSSRSQTKAHSSSGRR